MFETLKDEYNKVFVLFVRLQQTKNYYIGERKHLFNELNNKLNLLIQLENDVLYPKLMNYEEMNSTISNSKELEYNFRIYLNDLIKLPCDSLGWLTKVAELRYQFEIYFENMEIYFFHKILNVLDRKEILGLEKDLKMKKEQLNKQLVLR